MKKLNRKVCLTLSIALIGAMTCMSGCGSSKGDGTQETLVQTQIETQTETQIETQVQTQAETQQTESESATEIETETTQGTQEESTESQPEETQTAETQTETKAAEEPQAEEKNEPVQEAAPAAEGSVSAGDFAMVVKGVTIPLGSDLRDYTALLGEPDAYGAAKSCVEAGDDKVYTYGGVVIYTYITNGADIVSLIEVTGSESLPSGIHIGSTKQEVIAAYGSSYIEEGTELLYEMGNKTIGLQMNGDAVSFMELFGQ